MDEVWKEVWETRQNILDGHHGRIRGELIMFMANRLAGMSFRECIKLMSAIDRNDTNALEEMKEKFCDGCEKKGTNSTEAAQIYDEMIEWNCW